jgi:RIO-like serine/threonine protein kinase
VLSPHTSLRWGNAHVFTVTDNNGQKFVVKDFSACKPLVRQTWGRLILWRESRAFIRLQHIEGTPGPAISLEGWAIKYPYIDGFTLREAMINGYEFKKLFFEELEALVITVHNEAAVHLDLRNARNILVTGNGKPALIDFQTAIFTDHLPWFIRQLLFSIDFSGVYKHWERALPGTLSKERRKTMDKVQLIRPLWFIKGYLLRKNLDARKIN